MAEFKFYCPQCGQRIQCDERYSGTQINCPICQKPIVVPQAPGVAVVQPVRVKSQMLRNILVAAGLAAILAGLVLGGWYGFSKIRSYILRGHLPSGLVALWSGEGNGKDSIGGNNAALTDVTFAKGKVGQAFSFNGTSSSIKIPASKSLDVGKGEGLTLTAWIKPSDVSQTHPIFEWNVNNTQILGGWGCLLHIEPRMGGPGTLRGNFTEYNNGSHYFDTDRNAVVPHVFQFVALTYDKNSGEAKIYCNGMTVAQQNLGSFIPQTSYDLFLCYRPPTRTGSGIENFHYRGLLDEAAIYNRALSASEIKGIYSEQK